MSIRRLKNTSGFHLKGSGPSRAQISKHVIAPANVRNVQIETVDPKKEKIFQFPRVVRKFKKVPTLNVGAFGTIMHTILKDSVTGYILQVRHNGKLIYNLIWNWSQTPADKGQGWKNSTRMHVASLSKFLTAVGLTKALAMKKISHNAKIIHYLPTYWKKGKNIKKITFRHLLTHRSGFSTGKSSSDFVFMKNNVSKGVSAVGGYDYENMNFGLCRILIPIILGKISKNTKFSNLGSLNDKVWDAVTLYHYRSFMQSKVFTPAGVKNVGFSPIPATRNALAYRFPHGNQKGWNSGNLASVAGGAGWRVSIHELLNIMHHVRRRNTIISPTKAQFMLDSFFGIDQRISTPAGKIYNKNGSWRSNGRTEQSVLYFFPQGLEAAVFVNSPIGPTNFSLRGIVKDAYVNALG